MGLESINNHSYTLNKSDLNNQKVKNYYIENRHGILSHFFNSLKDLLIDYEVMKNIPIKIYPYKKEYLIITEAIITLKENWAKNLDELDKFYFDPKSTINSNNFEDQNTKINDIQKESEVEQKKSLDQAKQLSKQIKSWENI